MNATVITARECAWSLASDASWVQVRPANGEGETAVEVTVAENAAGVSRTAALNLAGTRVVIIQEAASCRYQVNGPTGDVSERGESVSVRITATEACGWTASSNVAWLTGVRTSGTGSGAAEFAAVANQGPQRSGVITVAGQSVPVTQRAAASQVPTQPLPPHPSPSPPAPSPTPTPTPPPLQAVELKGRVSDLGGTCPSLTFSVDSRRVATTSETRFNRGECRDLRAGVEVVVEGVVASSGTIQARRVEMKKD